MAMDLTDFEMDVLYNVMLGTTTPKVIDSRGHTPLIACLDGETISVLLKRIEKAGGCGTIYALSDTGEVSILAVQEKDRTDSETDTLSNSSSIRELIEYVSTQDGWVQIFGLKMRSYGATTTLSSLRGSPRSKRNHIAGRR